MISVIQRMLKDGKPINIGNIAVVICISTAVGTFRKNTSKFLKKKKKTDSSPCNLKNYQSYQPPEMEGEDLVLNP